MNAPLVLLAGNLGAGKTTLARRLAEHFGWWVGFESVSDNPYLSDFYTEMTRWSFHLQLYFLTNRIRLHEQASQKPDGAVLDRSIYEDRYIFAESLWEQGFISERDFQVYKELFDMVVERLRAPDLILYLRAPISVLSNRIRERGQAFDRDISPKYLEQIDQKYCRWISVLPQKQLLVFDSTTADFTADSSDSPQMAALFSNVERLLQ